ncbi:integrase [Herbaspirillum sp. Sphag1AN]|uniref:tyrosine-type recombinase/integrase n=1 Tax=unclassified Herbaspirillum TaxID=2624150 RepID=UPI00161B9810|nr:MULTISPECIES: integrase [unclassified Herbaspirillum]MBB3213953.1 integrase [Herbaspirillum sp. Sphag1AN]MBB3247150.1 integrase [Herbaspirillum sp. Sphag64]
MGFIQVRVNSKGKTSYQARVCLKDHPHQSMTFPTQETAREWINSIEAPLVKERAARAIIEAHRQFGLQPLREFFERYLRDVTPTKKSHESEKYRLGKILRSDIVNYPIKSLSPVIVAEWRDCRLKEVAPDTVTRELHMMSRIINLARREWGLDLLQNPFAQITKPKCSRGRVRRLKEYEERALLDAANAARGGFLRTIIPFAVETAMRRGEIIELDWRYIDLEQQTAYLPDTKNGEARAVPLSTKAVAILRALTRCTQARITIVCDWLPPYP